MKMFSKFKKWALFVEGIRYSLYFAISSMVILVISVFLSLPPFILFLSFLLFIPYFLKIRKIKYPQLARLLEKKFPEYDEKFLTYLDFQSSTDENKKKIADKIGYVIHNIPYRKAYPLSILQGDIRRFLWMLLFSFVLFTLFPYNYATFFYPVHGVSLFLRVSPGDETIFLPANVTISATPFGQKVDKVFLLTRRDGEITREAMTRDEGKFFKNVAQFKPETLSYSIQADGISSKYYRLEFLDKPFLTGWKIVITPPPSIDIPPETLLTPMPLVLLPGTHLEINAKISTKTDSTLLILPSKSVQFENSRNVHLSIYPKNKGDLKVVHYLRGSVFEDPNTLSFEIGEDTPPRVFILFPPFSMEIPEGMKIPMEIFVKDDITLSKVDLIMKGMDIDERKTLKTYQNIREDTIFYLLDLSSYDLLPGDTVAVWFEAFDRDIRQGKKKGVSRKILFWIPTFEEIYRQAGEEVEKGKSSLEFIERDVSSVFEDVEKIASQIEELQKKGEGFKGLKKELKALRGFSENLEKQLKELEEKFKEMEKGITLDPELAEKIAELQKLFKEVMTEEMKKALKEIQEALQQMDPEKLKQAFKEFKIDQEVLKKQIERTIDLLERVRQEIKLKELIERMEKVETELEKQQLSSSESFREEMKESISRMQEELEKIEEEMEKLAKSFKGEEEKVGEQIESAKRPLENAQSSLQQSSGQCQIGNINQALKESRKAQEQVSTSRKMLQEAQKMLQQMRGEEVVKELENAFFAGLFLSEVNKGIIQELKNRKTTEAEKEIDKLNEGVRRYAERILRLARKNPKLSRKILNYAYSALYGSQELKANITIFDMDKAMENAREVYNYLNLTSLEILRLQSQAQSGGAQNALMNALKSLAQIAKEQRQLNALAQSLLPLNFQIGEGPSQEFLQKVKRLSQMQQGLAEQLGEAIKEIEKGGGLEGLEKSLKRALEEMKDVTKELLKGEVTRKLVERQERILSRLLEAQRSIHKREFTKQRFAKPAEPYQVHEPATLGISEEEKIQDGLKKLLKSSLPQDKKAQLKAYYDELLKNK